MMGRISPFRAHRHASDYRQERPLSCSCQNDSKGKTNSSKGLVEQNFYSKRQLTILSFRSLSDLSRDERKPLFSGISKIKVFILLSHNITCVRCYGQID